MREEYINEDDQEQKKSGRVLVVGHDWGAIVGFRLAAEAPRLANRFILSNSVHVRFLERSFRKVADHSPSSHRFRART